MSQTTLIHTELSAVASEISLLKDSIHHVVTCEFSSCIIARHLRQINTTVFLMEEKISKQTLAGQTQIQS